MRHMHAQCMLFAHTQFCDCIGRYMHKHAYNNANHIALSNNACDAQEEKKKKRYADIMFHTTKQKQKCNMINDRRKKKKERKMYDEMH